MTKQQKHPRGLMVLFFTEMWERFSYYGMRALLVLYLISELVNHGFGLTRPQALEIYGIFTGLVYVTPLIGGYLADKILGQRKSIFIGGILMSLGQFALAASVVGQDLEMRHMIFNLGLGIMIVGNGFFKPNISTIVGHLYEAHDPRKDSAFTIFYMGINLGAVLSPIIAGTLGEKLGWQYGFASAGIGMLIGTIWFHIERKHIDDKGLPPNRVYDASKRFQLNNKDRFDMLLYVVLISVGVYGLLEGWSSLSDGFKDIFIKILALVGSGALTFVIIKNTKGKNEWSRVFVVLILCFFNIFFWSGFEQAGGTFNLFAAENTNRDFFSWEIPASLFQSVNAFFIIILAPLFSRLWMFLSSKNIEPRTPVKFAIALLLLGAGFIVMGMAYRRAETGVLVSSMWLVAVYFLHTTGELCLSPIGLSMVSKLSPQKIASVMMGVWFASIALAQYLAAILEAILHKYLPDMQLFSFLTITTMTGGVILLIISPILNKMMKGVH